MDLTCIPDEIKLIIISYLPLNKLITDEPLPIFHEYIMNYINTKLLTNMYYAGRLYNSDIYSDIVYNKLNEISSNITTRFIKEIDEIGGPINTNNINNNINIINKPIISLKIIFKFTKVGKHYNSFTGDIKYSLSSFGMCDNSCSWFYNDSISAFEYNEENIQNEIWRILIKNVDCSDTTIDIKSMEMIKTEFLNDTNSNILIKFI